MKVLVDTDIWLDVALGRDGHDTSLATLYGCIDDGIVITAAATTLKDAFTIASAADDRAAAYKMLERLMELAEILPVDRIVCRSALQLRLSNYGDGILAACKHPGRVRRRSGVYCHRSWRPLAQRPARGRAHSYSCSWLLAQPSSMAALHCASRRAAHSSGVVLPMSRSWMPV